MEMSLCRMCAGAAEPGVCLLDPAHQRLAACARDNLNISISADDGYPTRICLSCADDLRKWMAFRERNQKALSLFTKVLKLSEPPSGVRVAPSLPQSGGGASPDTCSVVVRTGTREETAREPSQVTENIQPEVRPARTFLDKRLQPSQTLKSPVVTKASTSSAVKTNSSYKCLAGKFSLKELRVCVTRLSEEELASLGQTKTWPGQKKFGCSLPQGAETASSKAGSDPKPVRVPPTRSVGGTATNQQASSCGQELSDSCSAGRKTLCGGEQLTEEGASLLSQLSRGGERRVDLQSTTRPRLLLARHKTSPGGVRAKSRVPDDCDKGRRPRCDVGAPPEVSPPNLNASKEDRKFPCVHCGKIFTQNKNILRHIRTFHKEVPCLYKCEVCGSTFKKFTELSAHKRSSHTLSDLKVLSCYHCDQKFRFLWDVRAHIERCHNNGARPYLCTLCGASFKTKSVLWNHNLNKHSIDRRYSCLFCTKKFKTSSDRNEHVKRLHTKGPRMQCDQCPSNFKVKKDLQKHKRCVHSNRPKFSCYNCEKKFKYKLTLRDHMDRYHGDGLCRYKCTVCQAAFITFSALNSHRWRKHPGVNPVL